MHAALSLVVAGLFASGLVTDVLAAPQVNDHHDIAKRALFTPKWVDAFRNGSPGPDYSLDVRPRRLPGLRQRPHERESHLTTARGKLTVPNE